MRVYIFVAAFLLLLFSLHYLFYSRVIKKLLVSDSLKHWFTLLVSLNFTFNILYVLGRYTNLMPSTLYYIFSLSLGITLVLFLYLVLHEVLNLFHKTLKPVDHSKRKNIVGVTDRIGYRTNVLVPDIHKAFKDCHTGYQSILLAHQPKFIEELGRYTPELILSGHTHGGQIWPFEYLVRLQQPYVKGLHKLPNGSQIYVNSGIGFWGPPMRLGTQAEIAYIV